MEESQITNVRYDEKAISREPGISGNIRVLPMEEYDAD